MGTQAPSTLITSPSALIQIQVFGHQQLRMYLALKERAASFRRDPRVLEAMKKSNIHELEVPTLSSEETWRDLAKDSFDVEEAGKRGYGYEILDQLAMEHLMGFVK